MSVPDHVQNPDAWLRARAARIKSNRSITNARKLDAAIANDTPEFRAWLRGLLPDHVEALRAAAQAAYETGNDDAEHKAYTKAYDAWRKRVGNVPEALREALVQWGGLTDKQLAWARSTFAKNVERAEGRDAAENARRASAPSWTPGRQTFAATIQSAKLESFAVGPRGYHSSTSCKAVVTLEDGRKAYVTLPRALYESISGPLSKELKGQRVVLTATMTPAKDDATMAFGKRPTLATEADLVVVEQRVTKRTRTTKVETTTTPVETPSDAPRSETKAEAKARRARERRAARKAAATSAQ
jgi:hypothetical protein